ncbi:hypothetical protein KEM55_007504 [Ascosphaera atra]|nr:hypothetical protein KEM55_007504 [Ascosphaera atra]
MPAIEERPGRLQVSARHYAGRTRLKLTGYPRRGMIDMRKRFRGNQPYALSKEKTVDPQTGETVEKTTREPAPMLYAGKPAYGAPKPVTEEQVIDPNSRGL